MHEIIKYFDSLVIWDSDEAIDDDELWAYHALYGAADENDLSSYIGRKYAAHGKNSPNNLIFFQECGLRKWRIIRSIFKRWPPWKSATK